MTGVGAEVGILAGLFGCDEAEGLDGILFQESGVVDDPFVLGNKAKFGGLRVGRHAVGSFADFLNRGPLSEDEKIVLGDVGIGEVEADRLACFDGEFFLGEEEALGDAGNFDGLKAFLRIKRSFGGTTGGGFDFVRFFEIGESLRDGRSVCGILPVGFQG